jgi:hypothetical protein
MQNAKTQKVVWEFSSALSSIASFSQISKIKMDYKMYQLVRNMKLFCLFMWLMNELCNG